MAHTAGPFEAGELDGETVAIWADEQEKYIGSVDAEDVGRDECIDNSRLFAASPTLLEACELVEGVLHDRGTDKWFPIQVRLAVQDAIRKATGT